MLTNPSTDINSMLPVNDDMLNTLGLTGRSVSGQRTAPYCEKNDILLVNWSFKEESYDILPTVNVCLAAYTTAQARLKLYSYMKKLRNKVIYTDTDSVIYISKTEKEDIPLGNFLGEMTNELECYGKVI